jgi:hypothetical protein
MFYSSKLNNNHTGFMLISIQLSICFPREDFLMKKIWEKNESFNLIYPNFFSATFAVFLTINLKIKKNSKTKQKSDFAKL